MAGGQEGEVTNRKDEMNGHGIGVEGGGRKLRRRGTGGREMGRRGGKTRWRSRTSGMKMGKKVDISDNKSNKIENKTEKLGESWASLWNAGGKSTRSWRRGDKTETNVETVEIILVAI